MLVATHFAACLWYGVAVLQSDRENWIGVHGYKDQTIESKYIMSYRWALSQFAGGMDEIVPTSFPEHLFAGASFVLAFWSGNVIVSTLTSHMTQVFVSGSQQKQQLTMMRRYLGQNGVS